jgi:5-methylcytosine-specific restriction endonuclease McrA
MRVHLEVNHIDPRNGAGYGRGCWNHLDGLETLCRVCHVDVTTQQIRDRKQALSRQLVLEAQ